MKSTAASFAAGIGIALAFAILIMPGSGRAAELTAHEKQLAAAAKKEGEVTIINASLSDLTSRQLAEGFKERYGLGPDFQFNSLRKGTGGTVAQARQEIRAGKFTVDVVLVAAPGFFEAALQHGALLKLDSDYWKDSEELARKADQYFHYPYVVVPNASSFQPIWNSSCPGMSSYSANSYDDVVKPELKGKTIASDITKSFTYTNTAISLQENGVLDLKKFWRRLKATDPIIEFRTEPKIQMLVSCQRSVDMWNLTGRAYQSIVKEPALAEKLKWGVYKEGQVLFGNAGAVLKGAPHPAAGQLLLEYMLSKEGTDIVIANEAVYSFRKNYQPPAKVAPYLFDLNTTKLLGLKDWIAAQKKFKEVRAEWTAVFR